MVESAIHMLPSDVALLARPPKISDARLVTPEGVEQSLEFLGAMYPFVVIDLPRTFSFLTSVALNEAELVMIVAQLSIPSIRNASRLYDLLQEMGVESNKIEIVLNRCRAEHQRVTADDVEQHFRKPIFSMIPNDYRRVTAALDFGHPIVTESPTSPARLAIQELAKTVAKDRRSADESSPGAANRGIFKRWWGGSKSEVKTSNV
jgi:pilus assembly protein CpaE